MSLIVRTEERMFINYQFHEAAFKHGATEEDIRMACSRPLFDGLLENYDDKFLLTGFDTRGNILEIGERLNMAVMTEEEANALDELLTKTTPNVNPAVKGITAKKGFKMMPVDDFSAEYITPKPLPPVKLQRK
jgi:hypothetical protein